MDITKSTPLISSKSEVAPISNLDKALQLLLIPIQLLNVQHPNPTHKSNQDFNEFVQSVFIFLQMIHQKYHIVLFT
jgi:hypothetical protein